MTSDVLNSNAFDNLVSNIYEINNKLKETISNSQTNIEKLFELKNKKLEIAKEITINFENEKVMSVIDRYSGVMFKSIDYNSFEEKQLNNFNTSVLFIDGLFGLLRPLDKIPNYKLKVTSKIGDLDITKYWQKNLRETLLKNLKGKVIIDLLPQAQRKILKYVEDDLEIIKINFFECKLGVLKNSGHISKQLKGDIVRYIVSKDIINLEDIAKFEHISGYLFDDKLSTSKELKFVKNID